MKLNLLTLFLVFDHYIGFFASPIAEPQDYDYYVGDEVSDDYGSYESIDYDDYNYDEICFVPEELGSNGK